MAGGRLVARSERIEVRASPRHGLGVFARTALRRGSIVERCPVLLFAPDDGAPTDSATLNGYCYDWGDGTTALALGFGSLYNHSFSPNADYAQGPDGTTLVVRARRAIAAGEEVTIDYTDGGRIELWFEACDS